MNSNPYEPKYSPHQHGHRQPSSGWSPLVVIVSILGVMMLSIFCVAGIIGVSIYSFSKSVKEQVVLAQEQAEADQAEWEKRFNNDPFNNDPFNNDPFTNDPFFNPNRSSRQNVTPTPSTSTNRAPANRAPANRTQSSDRREAERIQRNKDREKQNKISSLESQILSQTALLDGLRIQLDSTKNVFNNSGFQLPQSVRRSIEQLEEKVGELETEIEELEQELKELKSS